MIIRSIASVILGAVFIGAGFAMYMGLGMIPVTAFAGAPAWVLPVLRWGGAGIFWLIGVLIPLLLTAVRRGDYGVIMIVAKLIFGGGFVGGGFLFFAGFSAIPFGEIPGAPAWVLPLIQWGPAGIFWMIGGFTLLGVLNSVVALNRKRQLASQLIERGELTNAKITWMQNNYRVRIGGQPIFCIVQYTFEVHGQTYTKRLENVPIEYLQQAGLHVDSVISIRYLPEDPRTNGWEPAELPQTIASHP